MKRNHIIGAVIVLLIVGGGAFYAGDAYAKSQSPARGNFAAGGATAFANRAGGAGARGAGTTGGFTAGQIVSSNNSSISIKMQNGSSTEIVLLSPSTQILKSAAGTASDLTVGTEVTVTGSANSDGSMSASSIQIRPAGASPIGGFGGRASGGASQTTQTQ